MCTNVAVKEMMQSGVHYFESSGHHFLHAHKLRKFSPTPCPTKIRKTPSCNHPRGRITKYWERAFGDTDKIEGGLGKKRMEISNASTHCAFRDHKSVK